NEFIDNTGNIPQYNEAYADSILFTSSRGIGSSFIPSIHIMYKDGSGIRSLTSEWFTFGASWSPDRWKVLFITDASFNEPERGLYVMDLNGNIKERLTPIGEDVWYGSYSPDGNHIAYIVLDDNGRGKIRIMSSDYSNPRDITGYFGQLRKLTWSRDSKSIAFSGFISGGGEKIYIVNIDGSGTSSLFNYFYGCYSPAWSPKEDLIAFQSFASIGGTHYSQIFTYNISTKKIKQITSEQKFYNNPSWSPDGLKLVASAQLPGTNPDAIYMMDANGDNIERLTDDSAQDYSPCWY
ncbi:MAG: PD40 domain-containing protein, partial [Bacteroidetes bacterium]|nr:PD40 domain-containing protein [Bacteroidota bacterium]